MKFVTKKIVYRESGENWGTLSALCFLEDFTGNIEEKTTRFFGHDTDQRITVPLYEVRESTVPDIPGLFDTGLFIKVKFAIGLAGIEALQSLTEKQFYSFLELSEYNQYIFGMINEKCFVSTRQCDKSEFLCSLRDQFLKFLDGKSRYKAPFSEKQYSALNKFRIYKRDAERISTKLYYSKVL